MTCQERGGRREKKREERRGVQRSTHHLQFDLDAKGLLFDGGDAGGEGLPHAGGPTQSQLGAALQPCNGPCQHCGARRAPDEKSTNVLPVKARGGGHTDKT